jgi:hypothetical protein
MLQLEPIKENNEDLPFNCQHTCVTIGKCSCVNKQFKKEIECESITETSKDIPLGDT